VISPAGEKLFDKILVANRGEIACRIMRTAKRLGIKTVAVYSEADAHSLHVKTADEAVYIGPSTTALSYLNVPNIVAAIKATGAQAVHPGYGFLSEKHFFAQAVEEAGAKFIGPPVDALISMGDKITSKNIAKKAGVSTVPGLGHPLESEEEVIKVANDIGYPVMVKASGGGGGKGMRVAYNDKEAITGFRLSKAEAKMSFANDHVFIEKYIDHPRHIEIQLIADDFGNVVAFPERECSIQRRNQKVFEESPSVLLDPATRKAMQDQAAALARAVGYRCAGTVEFLCDPNKNFYYLEMNTRLQVEHPVTEYITGVDLVEQMIRVSSGYPLPPDLVKGLPIKGWALETRLYAEDPYRNFLPSIGRLAMYREPAHGEEKPAVRVDTGIREGSEISMHYDPLICKLVTHGKNRQESIDNMIEALDTYVVHGVGHNAHFLRSVLTNPRFVSGQLSTAFIPEEFPDGFSGVKLTPKLKHRMAAIGAAMMAKWDDTNATLSGQDSEYSSVDSSHLIITVADEAFDVQMIDPEDNDFAVEVKPLSDPSATPIVIHLHDLAWNVEEPLFVCSTHGEKGDEPIRAQHLERLPEGFKLQLEGAVANVICRTPLQQALSKHMIAKPPVDNTKNLLSPMPGKLVSVYVTAGQEVEEGQELCIVEAMKMQNMLRAPKKTKIKSIKFAPGATLKVDAIIMDFEV